MHEDFKELMGSLCKGPLGKLSPIQSAGCASDIKMSAPPQRDMTRTKCGEDCASNVKIRSATIPPTRTHKTTNKEHTERTGASAAPICASLRSQKRPWKYRRELLSGTDRDCRYKRHNHSCEPSINPSLQQLM